MLEGGAEMAVPLSRVCNEATDFSRRAANALIKIGRAAVEPLVQVVKSGDRERR